MADKVISLRGDPIPEGQGLPVNEDCVRVLKELLERAEAGDLVGMAYVAAHHDDTLSSFMIGNVVSYAILGGLFSLTSQMREDIKDAEDGFIE